MTYYQRIIFLLATAGMVALAGCSKDDANPCGCVPLKLTQDPLDYQQEGSYPIYARPSFDPAGSGQIAYIKGGGDGNRQLDGLWRADLATHQEKMLVPGNDFQLFLDWGKRGLIAYNSLNGQIMTVKSNGDSLRQITSGIAHYLPRWSPDGNRIVCELDGPRPQQYGLVILNEHGRQQGPILAQPYGYAYAWSPDSRQLAVVYALSNGVNSVGTYDFGTHELRMVAPLDRGQSSINGAVWLPDSRTILWASSTGIFKVDTQTGETVKLRSGCDSRIYLSPSISADGKTLIVQRVDRQLVKNNTTIREESNLWTMGTDGSNEQKVVF